MYIVPIISSIVDFKTFLSEAKNGTGRNLAQNYDASGIKYSDVVKFLSCIDNDETNINNVIKEAHKSLEHLTIGFYVEFDNPETYAKVAIASDLNISILQMHRSSYVISGNLLQIRSAIIELNKYAGTEVEQFANYLSQMLKGMNL